MKCIIENGESSELLLAYCARKLDAETTAILERHMEICPACREFAGNQRAVWAALDAWEASPVSADFDRRLYQRIEQQVSWWELLIRPFRPMLVRQAVPIAASAFVMLLAVGLMRQPSALEPVPQTESAQLESVQPEQVEQALETMQMLSDFNHQMRAAASESQM
jgi:anti-sigma factor RsiW